MNPRLQKLLQDMKPGRRGIHGTANAYDSADYYLAQISDFWQCGIDWLKLVVAGDSGVNTCRMLRDRNTGIIPIIRMYDTSCPASPYGLDAFQKYTDVGALIFESPFNEFYAQYENSFPNGQLPADWPAQVARGWSLFADACLRAGGVPTTPSIETWRYNDIFVPLMTILCRDYAPLMAQSVLACHPRTLNHPVSYTKDTGAWLGWRSMDDFILGHLGQHLPIVATESGPEPGWDQDKLYPPVTAESHRDMVRAQLEYKTPSYYLADCFWLWEASGGFADASWHNNQRYAQGKDLPVVEMLQTWYGDVPVAEFSDDEILSIGTAQTTLIRINPDAAFYKVAQANGFGHPETNEWREFGWAWQKWERGITACIEGDWGNIHAVPRP